MIQSSGLRVSDSFSNIVQLYSFRRVAAKQTRTLVDTITPVNYVTPVDTAELYLRANRQDPDGTNELADTEFQFPQHIVASSPTIAVPEPAGAPTMMLLGFAIGLAVSSQRKRTRSVNRI
jgi:hypothetical protein